MPILDIRSDADFDSFDTISTTADYRRTQYARCSVTGTNTSPINQGMPAGLRAFNIAYTAANTASSWITTLFPVWITSCIRFKPTATNKSSIEIQAYNGSNWTSLGSYAVALYPATQTAYRFIIEVDLSSEGFIKVYRDGTLIINIQQDLSTVSEPEGIRFYSGTTLASPLTAVSEYILATGDVSLHSSFVKTLVPDLPADSNQWTGDISNINTVEGSIDSPMTADTADLESIFSIQNPSLSGGIHALAVSTRALTTNPAVNGLAIGIQPPGETIEYSDISELTVGPSISSYIKEGVWAGAAISNMKVGIRSAVGGA